ncbi:MAG TPA: FixH family protein [Mucilaginibacter sp.]|nr:FixH family protein [Mucilaginibacter sp.]
MKIKLNWGNGIAIGMTAFAAFIVVLGVQMFRDSPGDYDHQYYEKGLAYDSVYAKEKQVIIDHAAPHFKLENKSMLVQFTGASAGHIRFERPSDPNQDQLLTFQSNSSDQAVIQLDKFAAGQWQVTLDWQSNGKKYLYQREIFLP